MTKLKKISFFLIALCSLFLIKDVKAGTLDTSITVNWIPGVYANRKVGGLNYYNQMGYIYANGVLSYCLESTKFITEDVYHSTTDFSSTLTQEQKDYIELIAYYGYGYQNGYYQEFYMAAQELIWEYLEGVDVYFTTGPKGTGDVINIESYKQGILYFIKTHQNLPEFKDQTYYTKEGETFIKQDSHNMIDRYEFNQNYPEIKLENRGIRFQSNRYGVYDFHMHMKVRNPISFLYFKGDSQTIGSFGLNLNNSFHFKIVNEPKEHALKLQKVDEFTNKTVKQAGIQFRIKNMDTGTYLENGKIYETNEEGSFYTKKIGVGNYEVEEITPPKNYYKKDKISFTIDESTPFVGESFYLTFGNEPFRSKIKIQKTGNRITSIIDGEILYQEQPLDGVTFDILAKEDIKDQGYLYYRQDEVVDHLTTNEEGIAESKMLPYGIYCIKEARTKPEFEKDLECHEVILNEPTTKEIEVAEKNLFNERKRTSFELKKEGETLIVEDDKYTYEAKPLKEITFNMYAGSDIVENGQVLLKKDELFKTLTTDEKGYLKLSDIPYGTYYLKEEVLENYEEVSPITFTFDEEHTTHSFKLLNKLKKGKVEIKKVDASTNLPLIGVKIGIYTKNGELIYAGVTDEKGLITLHDLAYGEYYIQEIESLSNYQLNDEKYEFTLDEEHQNFDLLLTNKKIPYPNTTTSTSIYALKSILVFLLGIGLLRRYLA